MVHGLVDSSVAVRKVRRGTRSCWECKRRKIRCRYTSNDASTCDWCLSRGSSCVSQLHADGPGDQASDRVIPARLLRIETMLEELVEKSDRSSSPCRQPHLPHETNREGGPGNDVLSDASPMNHPVTGGSILSLFNNSIFRYKTSPENSVSNHGTCSLPTALPVSSKIDRLSAHLLSMFPSHDVITALDRESTPGITHLLDAIPTFRSKQNFSLLDALAPCSSTKSPTVIARALMCLVVCLQQLPKGHDITRIHLSNDVRDSVDDITSSIFSLVTSDDELVATLEGLECLMLQNIFFINAVKPRRAWLSARRAMAIAQLLGLQRIAESPGDEGSSPETHPHSSVWPYIRHSERFLSLILGVPYGVQDRQCSRPRSFRNLQGGSADTAYLHQLDMIAGRVIDRERNSSKKDLLAAQSIQDELERLAESISQSWWDIPNIAEEPDQISTGLSYGRLNTQIWHFQLEISLNLPFMFNTISSFKFEYSQLCCLRAARELIKRHALVRKSSKTFSCCLTNFQAFMAALILTINLLKPSSSHSPGQSELEKQADWTTVTQVIQQLDAINACFDDRVALQSVDVLKTLRALEFEPDRSIEDIRLTIPYFGTISIGRRATSTDTTSPTGEHQESDSLSENQGMDLPSQQDWADLFTIDLDMHGCTQFPPAPDVLLQSWSSEPSAYSCQTEQGETTLSSSS